MSKERIKRIIDTLTAEWGIPRTPARILAVDPTLIGLTECTAERSEEAIVYNAISPDLLDFWNLYKSANLFLEVESQLWGLKLFSHEESKAETIQFKSEPYPLYKEGDLVIGMFGGYPDKLVVRCDPQAADFGTVLVAIYDGFRNEWYQVANSFTEFLERYAKSEGETYWEKRGGVGKDW